MLLRSQEDVVRFREPLGEFAMTTTTRPGIRIVNDRKLPASGERAMAVIHLLAVGPKIVSNLSTSATQSRRKSMRLPDR